MTAQQTFESVKPMIEKLVWQHLSRHGGDHEEVQAEAYLAYSAAYARYNPTLAKLSTWTWHAVRNRLRDLNRRRQPVIDADADVSQQAGQPNFTDTLRADLSEGGKAIVAALFEAAEEVSRPAQVKRRAVRTLLESGWALTKVLRALRELQEAVLSS